MLRFTLLALILIFFTGTALAGRLDILIKDGEGAKGVSFFAGAGGSFLTEASQAAKDKTAIAGAKAYVTDIPSDAILAEANADLGGLVSFAGIEGGNLKVEVLKPGYERFSFGLTEILGSSYASAIVKLKKSGLLPGIRAISAPRILPRR
jgi:hypothetical protein